MSEQLLKTTEHRVKATGVGNTIEEAVGKIFASIRNQAYQDLQNMIIQIDTNEVYFDDVIKEEKKERFLFLFMPRIKVKYTVSATVVVTIKYLDLEKEDV